MNLRRFFLSQSLVLRRCGSEDLALAPNGQTVSQILATLECL
jgi:hypothetical protein